MEIIADLHIHSKYSRAVSQQMIIPEITKWAKRKGIGLMATGDWTHPLWLRELKENLVEVAPGLYTSTSEVSEPLFLLSTEISSIYTQNGNPHRIHNLVFAPSFSVVEEINSKLRSRGVNLLSDGRPITGLSSIELCELVFSVSKDCLIIPAHVWTPWYSLYGSRSGFDSIKECFGEFADKIKAIETGLSSDPAMNWRIKELDNRSIVSFSDAHSPAKLGREATVFEIPRGAKLSYEVIKKAIVESGKWEVGSESGSGDEKWGKKKSKSSPSLLTSRPTSYFPFPHISYTIEFYPQEGKYHYTGHRSCGVKQSPEETKKLGTTCPICGKKLTVGVIHRVEELANRPSGFKPENRPRYKMLVPLVEILSEALGFGISSQIVGTEYNRLVTEFGSEFNVLLKAKIAKIMEVAGEKVAEGIKRARKGDLVIDPGYDGVFGKVKIWGEKEKEPEKQMSLF